MSVGSNSSVHPLLIKCYANSSHIYIGSAFFVINILLLPVLVPVLYLGYQQWRRQRRSAPTTTTATAAAATAISHTDCLTYHSVAMQLNEFLGFVILFCGRCLNNPQMVLVGLCTWSVTSLGQALVNLLMCVVHYLAVVHPITYLGLKKTGRLTIGNITIGCVWLLCFAGLAVSFVTSSIFDMILHFWIVAFILIVISFCCISVLCALKRPRPGEAAGGRGRRFDQSKKRAFNTILVIMGVLWFRFLGNMICNVIYNLPLLSPSGSCMLSMFVIWFDLPSSSVLPLLFLHRAGKLQCRKRNTESG